MAGKTSKPASKKSNPGKKSSGAARPAARQSPARRSQPASAPTKPARKPKLRLSPPAFLKRLSAPRRRSRPVLVGLSLDRRLDILGVVLSLGGLLTLFSLLSATHGSLTGRWVAALRTSFGLGMYLFPFALVAVGLWLILRNFERIPQLAVERLAGFALLFVVLVGAAHLYAYSRTGGDVFDLVGGPAGGGYLGAVMIKALLAALGRGGAWIALLAGLLIGLALALDVSVLELFRWVSPVQAKIKAALGWAWGALISRKGKPAEQTLQEAGYAELQPVPGAPASSLAQGAAPGGYTPLGLSVQAEPRAWVLPTISEVLDAGGETHYDDEVDRQRARIIEETLASFGAPAHVIEINRGPTITQFGVEPDFTDSRGGRMRVRVGKIAALADDLALALSARTIRIQAPVPGKGFVGIEVPNDEISMVALRDVIESEAFKRLKSPLRFALGQNVAGMAVAADLAAMPHLLIAGATGSGKSVCVNALISCLLLNNTPDQLRLIMVDPKRVELTGYNGIPHLLAPVVVEMERVIAALQWVMREMDMRYRKLAEAGSRNIQDFNARQATRGQPMLPYLVVIIDELADLMMLAPDETERTVTRLAQLARATGIHLVIATQRPSVDVVTGLIKANFPARVAFAVASGVDSRVILDQPGAERLLGRGDMLFQAPDAPAPVRLQGVFVSDSEIQRLVQYWHGFSSTEVTTQVAVGGIVDALPSNLPLKQLPMWEEIAAGEIDPLMNEAIDIVRRQGRASISLLQRRLRVGYTRAARLIEAMEERGIVGAPDSGSGAREILDYGPAGPPAQES